MQAYSDEKINELTVTDIDGKYYIHIYENETEVENTDENGNVHKGYQYDFNEIIMPNTEDISDIKKHPSDYMDYKYAPVTAVEKLRADVDYLLLMTEG